MKKSLPAIGQHEAASAPPLIRRADRSVDLNMVAHAAGIANRLDDPDLVLFDEPVAGGTLSARSSTFKASFATDGWTFCGRPDSGAPHNEPIRFHLTGVHVGNEPIPIADVAPERSDQRIEYRHGGVLETIDVRGRAVEQTFTFAHLPQRGELTIAIGVDTSLAVRNTDAGIAFSSEYVDVNYGHAVAIDANGERVAAATTYADGQITIRVPTEFVQRAQLPLVIDPLVASVHVYTLLGLTAILAHAPDVAWDPNSQTWAVAFELPFSYDDVDVYLQVLDANLAPVGPPAVIDISYDVWQRPRIADLKIYSRLLVVAQRSVDSPGPYDIAGRIFYHGPPAGVLSPFIIEPAGANGGAYGNKLFPDVGGDASASSPTYFTVVWQREFSSTTRRCPFS